MIISLISIPIYMIISPDFLQGIQASQSVINITLVLLVWNLSLISLVFKRSFEVSTLMASVLAFNYFILFEVLIITFYPPLQS